MSASSKIYVSQLKLYASICNLQVLLTYTNIFDDSATFMDQNCKVVTRHGYCTVHTIPTFVTAQKPILRS